MEDRILELFDNWFGRFQFFRNFAKLLLAINKKMNGLENRQLKQSQDNIQMSLDIVALTKEIEDLKEKFSTIDPTKIPKAADFTKSSTIMDRQYEAYTKQTSEQ